MALIVLADDDNEVRSFLKFLLESKGYGCLDFSNGDDALDALRKTPEACLLLSDVSMPFGDGRDILETLRNGPPRLRHLPVLLISGLVPEQMLEETLKDPRIRFLQKPFQPNQLYGLLEELLALSGK